VEQNSTTKIVVTLYGYTRLGGYLFIFFLFLLFFRIWRSEYLFIYLLGDVGHDIYFQLYPGPDIYLQKTANFTYLIAYTLSFEPIALLYLIPNYHM
jgi:hypothetical protein